MKTKRQEKNLGEDLTEKEREALGILLKLSMQHPNNHYFSPSTIATGLVKERSITCANYVFITEAFSRLSESGLISHIINMDYHGNTPRNLYRIPKDKYKQVRRICDS